MQLVCEGLDLSDAVLKVIKATASKTTNPILEGIKLTAEDDTLTLSATDLDLAIEKKIKSDIKVEGEIVVPGRFFSEFVKKLVNEKIELTLNDKMQLSIKYTDSEGFIQCFKADEYPYFKKIESDNYFAITKKAFKNLISKSIFAVAIDDSRPILKGCLLEIYKDSIVSVALDGYRLAYVKEKISSATNESKVIVPARSLSEISKLLDDSDDIVNVYIQNNYIMVDLVDTKIISRLIEGEYMNYKQILSTTFETQMKVNKAQFEDALERASLLSKVGQNNLVSFNIKEQNLTVSSTSEIGNIKENVPISLSGKDLSISFNARYFTESFRVIADDFVNVSFNNFRSPCIIEPVSGDEYIFLILPVRVIN